MSRALNGDILTPRRGSRHCQQYRPLSGIIGLSTMLWLFKCERTAVMTNRKEGPRSNPARRPASILLPKTCGIASCLFHHRPARSARCIQRLQQPPLSLLDRRHPRLKVQHNQFCL